MATNALEFNQAATVLNAIQNQVTGQSNPVAVDASQFATVADITLKQGYEKVYDAISLVMGRTIMDTRPYNRKFKGFEMTAPEFKLRTRKLQIVDNTFEDNDTIKYPVHYDSGEAVPSGDGQSVDQQIIKKNKFVETNFYGMNTYADHYTIFDEQLDVAFTTAEEFSRFISMITMNISNRFEQARENFARYTLLNYAGALYANGSSRAINLLAEYNTATGGSYTVETIYSPANLPGFMKWVFARVRQICAEMTERSIKYQNPINGQNIIRHTPYEDQRLYMYAPAQYQMEASVLSSVFNDTYLKRTYTEEVAFWQNINQPDAVLVNPIATGTNGTPVQPGNQQIDHLFGVIFDRDAVGYSIVKSTMKAAPYNARADYRNFFLKDYQKNFNDVSEKGVLLYLKDAE
jgi:hypothetical protein